MFDTNDLKGTSGKIKRDAELASFLDKLATLPAEDFEAQRKVLLREFDSLLTAVGEADFDKDYETYEKYKHKKKVLHLVLAFCIGLVVAFLPSWVYVNTLNRTTVPEFHFVPNAVAERKPTYVQLLKTQAEVDAVKKAHIRDANLATIGAFVEKGTVGLTVVPIEETKEPIYHLKEIGVQADRAVDIDGYHFVPNAIYSSTIHTQIIENETMLESARGIKNLASRDLLGIGAGISCPQDNYCHVTAKNVLKEKYITSPIVSDFVQQ